MKGKKKTRAADIKRRLIDDERDPSPFEGIKLVEKKEPEKKAKPAVPLKAKKPSEIVQGYNPSSSFADILYSFEHTGNPYSMPAPKGGRIPGRKTDFGAILDQWEGKGRKKSKPSQTETKKSVYNPTRSFGDILDSFEGKKPEKKAGSAKPERKEDTAPEVSDTLFRKMDEDDRVSSSVSWTIFGGRNENFTRPDPVEEKTVEKPEKDSFYVRKSPAYSPSRSFSEILTEFESGRDKPSEKKEEHCDNPDKTQAMPIPEDTLFRKPEEGEARAEGAAWSIFGGNEPKPRKSSSGNTVDDQSPAVEGKRIPQYKGKREFSSILEEYGNGNGDKTFEEYIREKGEGEEHRHSTITISKLRTMPPQATLDLHGDTVKEAEAEVRRFLDECSSNGLRKVSIITGKGLHSEDGVGVLRQAVIKVLDESGVVSERTSAPLSAGGSGALWIILKA